MPFITVPTPTSYSSAVDQSSLAEKCPGSGDGLGTHVSLSVIPYTFVSL